MLEPPECSGRIDGNGAKPAGRLLLVGARRQVRRWARLRKEDDAWARLPFVGFVDHSGKKRQLVVHPQSHPVPALGRIDRLSEVVERAGITDMVVALRGLTGRRLRRELPGLTRLGLPVRVHWLGEGGEGPLALEVTSRAGAEAPCVPFGLLLQRIAKRALDALGAAAGLLVLSPLLLGVALAILATSGRPVFYTQERVGRGGRFFRIWKFRSMRVGAEDSTGPVWAEDHDQRCTKIGAWLRHTNIDELPQLWNVLTGDMSLVGPRPERPCFVERFKAEHADYDLRHAVPAGLTGWAQVHGWRGKTSLRKRIQYDLDYIDRWSLWLDIKILFMTIEHVLFGKTSWPARKSET